MGYHTGVECGWLRKALCVVSMSLLLVVVSSPVFAGDSFGSTEQARGEVHEVHIAGLGIDAQIAPIKSRGQLADYLRAHVGPENPLFPLSEREKRIFLESLVFTDRGLASFNAQVLEGALSVSQIYHVLSLFGLQRAAYTFDGARVESEADRAILELGSSGQPSDISVMCPVLKGTQCIPPATCWERISAWCVTCNCSKP